MNSWIFTFISEHPFYAFLLAWPIGLTIISICWQLATTLENGMNLILRLANQFTNAFVIAVRGYMPMPPPEDDESDDEPPVT